jgi:hypothetical protein
MRIRPTNDGISFQMSPGGASPITWTERVVVGPAGALYIGDTSDVNVTAGLVINQGANDDHIISLKSSDVAHGMTTLAETDTYARFSKTVAASGGFGITGLNSTTRAVYIRAAHGTDDTSKATSSDGAFQVEGQLKSGTGITSLAANANIAVIRNNGTTRFIFDADGDFHADAAVSASAYDGYNDAALLRALDVQISEPDTVIESRFKDWMQYNRADLERSSLVTFNTDGHHFVNYTKLARAQNGAVWQLYTGQRELEERLGNMEKMLGAVLARLGPPKGDTT